MYKKVTQVLSLLVVGLFLLHPEATAQTTLLDSGTAPNVSGTSSVSRLATFLNQPPNQSNAIFSDEGCDFCGASAQVVAENFTTAAPISVNQAIIWGAYFPGNAPPATDDFDILIHNDVAGLPGGVPIATYIGVVPVGRVDTGVDLFGVDEYMITLDFPSVPLAPGTYWIEIYNNTGIGDDDDWVWEVGNLDVINGIFNNAFSFSAPGAAWNPGNPTADNAIQLTDQGNLPVELTDFAATVDGSRIHLTWATATEDNNAGFSVEHSTDGFHFIEQGFVTGAGTTLEAQSYSYDVNILQPGLNYVRLKQIDFDGAFEYSPTLEVVAEIPGGFALMPAYPNPFNPRTTLQFVVSAEQPITATLYNSLGAPIRTLFSGVAPANEVQTMVVEGAGLASGMYIVRLQGANHIESTSIMLLK